MYADQLSGLGTDADPKQIWYLEDLQSINNVRIEDSLNNVYPAQGYTYKIMRDLDFNSDASYRDLNNKPIWTTGNGWIPLTGNQYNGGPPFQGKLLGNGKTINHLYSKIGGLFGVVFFPSITNLKLLNVDVNKYTLTDFMSGNYEEHNKLCEICDIYVTGILRGLNIGTSSSDTLNGLIGGASNNSDNPTNLSIYNITIKLKIATDTAIDRRINGLCSTMMADNIVNFDNINIMLEILADSRITRLTGVCDTWMSNLLNGKDIYIGLKLNQASLDCAGFADTLLNTIVIDNFNIELLDDLDVTDTFSFGGFARYSGANVTINNVSVTVGNLKTSGLEFAGMFNTAGGNVNIKNILVRGKNLSGNTGIFGGAINASPGSSVKITNCNVILDKLTIPGGGDQGGIVTQVYTTAEINDSSFTCKDISFDSPVYGGIVGRQNAPTTINNCKVKHSIKATEGEIGGLVGESNAPLTLNNSHSKGDMLQQMGNPQYGGSTNGVGGLVCLQNGGNANYYNCSNEGEINSHSTCGGLTGYCSATLNAQYCYQKGDIEGRAYTGGLIAQGSGSVNLSDSYMEGNIACLTGSQSSGSIGGFMGFGSGHFERCYHKGKITCEIPEDTNNEETWYYSYVGGFVGMNWAEFKDCFHLGDVEYKTNGNNVSTSHCIGMIAGATPTSLEKCYCAGSLTIPNEAAHGDIGQESYNDPLPDYSTVYVDRSKSGIDSLYCRDRSTTQMKMQSNYVDWDFSYTWKINNVENDGYPTLRMEFPNDTAINSSTVQLENNSVNSTSIEIPFTPSIPAGNEDLGKVHFRCRIYSNEECTNELWNANTVDNNSSFKLKNGSPFPSTGLSKSQYNEKCIAIAKIKPVDRIYAVIDIGFVSQS